MGAVLEVVFLCAVVGAGPEATDAATATVSELPIDDRGLYGMGMGAARGSAACKTLLMAWPLPLPPPLTVGPLRLGTDGCIRTPL